MSKFKIISDIELYLRPGYLQVEKKLLQGWNNFFVTFVDKTKKSSVQTVLIIH